MDEHALRHIAPPIRNLRQPFAVIRTTLFLTLASVLLSQWMG
jgi:hypothetical protein